MEKGIRLNGIRLKWNKTEMKKDWNGMRLNGVTPKWNERLKGNKTKSKWDIQNGIRPKLNESNMILISYFLATRKDFYFHSPVSTYLSK